MKHFLVPLLLICTMSVPPLAGQPTDNPTLNSLLSKLSTAPDDTNKVILLDDISWEYLMMRSYEGMDYAQQELELATRLDWRKGICVSNGSLGAQYNARAEYSKALEHFLISFNVNKKAGDASGMATSALNAGDALRNMSDYPKALEQFLTALNYFEQLDDKSGVILAWNNLSIVYVYQKEYTKALEYLERIRDLSEALGDKNELAGYYMNRGLLSARMLNYDEALEFHLKALGIYEETGDQYAVAGILNNLGNNSLDRDDVPQALDYYFKALALNREMGNLNWISRNQSNISNIYYLAAKGEPESAKQVLANQFKGNTGAALEEAMLYTDSAYVLKEQMGDLESMSESYNLKSRIQALMGDHELALASFMKHTELQDSIFNIEKDKKLTQTAMQYEFDKKEAKARAEQEKKDAEQRFIRNSIAGGLLGALIFLVVVYRQRNKIAKARKRSDELLLNILPEEVAEELKAKGAAEAVQIDQVTVLFTDFKGFTAMSEKMSPRDLVRDLNDCFSAFDRITEKYGIEKIKTIGDAYMAAGGLPTPNKTHATDVLKAAMEMRDFIAEGKARKIAAGEPFFDIRIGIHTGPVVAGIVGVKKFQYDIWGDTVNTASRMESSGEVGKVNISASTYHMVEGNPEYAFDYRGKVSAKGKGELDMYFVQQVA